MPRTVAWGIDIGESAIKAVKLRRVGDSIVIQDYRTVPCEGRADDAQGSDRDARVRSALLTLQRDVKLAGAAVAVSMPGRDVFPKFITLPPVEKKRIPELVRYEARTQMPFPVDEVIWDYQPLTEEIVPGEEVEVALFAIKRASVYHFLNNLAEAGIQPDLVEISPLAIYNFLMYDRPIETGTVLIDIGAGNTDLVIVDGDRFWTRNVSISGNDITRALQEKYQISFEEAENLKRKTASTKQAEKLFGVMRPILDDLIGEIQRSIGYYKAQSRNVRIEQIILLGNAFKLRGLIGYFRKNLDYEVALLDSLRRVKLGAESDQRKFEAELPNYGVAIGLALQALEQAKVNIDLMPPEVVRDRVLRAKIPWAAAGIALLALPIGLGFISVGRRASRVDQRMPVVDSEIGELQRIEGDVRKVVSEGEQVEEQLKKLLEVGTRRNQYVTVVDRLNRAFAQIPRDRFLVVRVIEVGAAERASGREANVSAITAEMMMEGMAPPDMPPGVARAQETKEGEEDKDKDKKDQPLTLEVQFERKGRPDVRQDGKFLLDQFRDPRTGEFMDGILTAEVREVKKATERDRGAAVSLRRDTPSEEDWYVFTIRVYFGDKTEAPAEGKTPEGDASER